MPWTKSQEIRKMLTSSIEKSSGKEKPQIEAAEMLIVLLKLLCKLPQNWRALPIQVVHLVQRENSSCVCLP